VAGAIDSKTEGHFTLSPGLDNNLAKITNKISKLLEAVIGGCLC